LIKRNQKHTEDQRSYNCCRVPLSF